MKESLWTKTATLTTYHKLEGNKKTDVLVIGGGMCGILCTYLLKQAGVDCMLVEGSKLASGITKNTTAKLTSLHGLIYDKLIHDKGKETAQAYLSANQKALKTFEKLCKDIDCDYETRPAYTYSMTDRTIIEKEVFAAQALGFPATFVAQTELPFSVAGAICFPNQAQFHPLKFLSYIAENLPCYEDTFIYDITPHTAISNNGKITANKIIVATHFPFINKHGSYFLKLYQHRTYVTAFQNAQKLAGMYVDENIQGLSFRTYQNLLLLGGGSHRTGKSGGSWKELHAFAQKYYPQAKPQYEWATQDCMTLDAVPYIGKYSGKTPDLYVATGFHKWGMTGAMVAATLLCDMVQDKKNDLESVFSPQRSILTPQLVVNCLESAANLLTPSTKRCPHLGCALKWNKYEHTWDCPCHGSRFSEEGKLIDNPATGDAKVK